MAALRGYVRDAEMFKDHASAGQLQIILHVRFAAHNGLNSNIAACPKSANSGNRRSSLMPGSCDILDPAHQVNFPPDDPVLK
jgi:hypothetical protein